MDDQSFLGTGWSFPPTFHNGGVGVDMVSKETDIAQSLEILLSTKLGERLMLPLYGCDLYPYLFESISNSSVHLINDAIKAAIVEYEPRIKLLNVIMDESDYLDGIIRINLNYEIIATNTRYNLVFPYYQVEGTDISELYRKQVERPELTPSLLKEQEIKP